MIGPTAKSIVSASAFVLLAVASAAGQGSIYGSVVRSGGSTPIIGDLSFVGYLDNTDEEIRVETSVGAGYDGGFWFDDFQNFQTESPGNPYAYHFFDLAQGEGMLLTGTIPDNSFQQEDIVLAAISWPSAPTSPMARFTSADTVEVTWDSDPGVTVHVYRRSLPAAGSFYRIDDPAGSLANPGVSGGRFVDAPVDSALSYQYLLIAEDDQGHWGAHSQVITVEHLSTCCLVRGDIDHSGALPLDIADLVSLVDFMFTGGAQPSCLEEADVNADGALTIDIADLVFLIDYMFLAGPLPSPCF